MGVAIIFIGLLWYPGSTPTITVLLAPDMPTCLRMEKTFTLSTLEMNMDEERRFQAVPDTSCQKAVGPGRGPI